MFGTKILAAALLLPSIIAARPSNVNTSPVDFTSYKEKGWIKNGKLELPMAQYCNPWITQLSVADHVCTKVTKLVQEIHVIETALFCSDNQCNAKYDPSTGLCLCAWGTVQQMNEDRMWPGKGCEKSTTCYAPYEAHWNPSTQSCACAIETFPELGSPVVHFMPDPVKESMYGPTDQELAAQERQ